MGLSLRQVAGDEFNWSQDLLKNGVLEMPKPVTGQGRSQQQQQMAPLKCPRCDSTNTKFCYYNNYSHSQPRHLCKACRRHWTAGGNLRNVPVGGGRKTKRPKTTNTNSTTSIANNVNQGTSTFQHLHQQPVLSFGGASERSIFPDVFRRVLLQPSLPPPPTGHNVNRSSNSFMGSLVSPLFPTQFAGIAPAVTSSYDSIISPFSVTSSSSSSTFVPEDLTIMNGSSALGLPELPSSTDGMGILDALSSTYWGCWDDDITSLVEPQSTTTKTDDSSRP